jgi:S1-C subfamily serine protease
VLSVEDDSVAKAAGFKEGDILLSMDGTALNDREVLNRLLAEKNWGDSASFTVRRDDREIQFQVLFRRQEAPTQPPK